MKALTYLLTIFLAFLLLQSCGGSKDLTDADEGDIPNWYLNTPEDPNYIFEPNTSTSRDLQMAVDKATTGARAGIGRQIETNLEGLQKQFAEEVGEGENSNLYQQMTQATKTVVKRTLNGSKVVKKKVEKDGDIFRAYVLMQYPIGSARKAFLSQIKNDEEMYTRFRSSKAFEELQKEVEKYDDQAKFGGGRGND